MKFMLIFALALSVRMAGAKVVECATILGLERQRLAEAIAHTLATDEVTGQDPRLVRLDLDILTWASARMERLSAGQRENVFLILENSELGSRLDNGNLAEHEWLEDAQGQLYVSDQGVRLVLDAFETASEASRFTLRHELTHLFRIIEEGSPARTAAKAVALIHGRRLGLLREEAYAHRDDYRYLRRNYTEDDVFRLAARVADLELLQHEAEARGFLEREADGAIGIDLDRMTTYEDQVLLFQMLTAEADTRMLHRVKRALELSEASYVKSEIKHYQVPLGTAN